MYSVSSRRGRAPGAACALSLPLVLTLLCASCDRGRDAMAMMQTPPVVRPLGPVPGPQPDDAGLTTNPLGEDEVAIRQGRLYFGRYNCSGCHGDHAGGGMGPSLRDATWIYGGTDSQIYSSIVDGRAHGMPSWASKLTDDLVWSLVAYIRSLRTPREPEPPDETIPAPPEATR